MLATSNYLTAIIELPVRSSGLFVDIPLSMNSNVQCHNEGTYSVKFVQHAAVQQQLPPNFVIPVDAKAFQDKALP